MTKLEHGPPLSRQQIDAGIELLLDHEAAGGKRRCKKVDIFLQSYRRPIMEALERDLVARERTAKRAKVST